MVFTTIDEYISIQPPEIQPALFELLGVIRAAAPGAVERIAYRMPCFYIGAAYLCGFAAFKRHVGFYPGAEPVAEFYEQLKRFKKSKGAVQFSYGTQMDYSLVKDIIAWRVSKLCIKRLVHGARPVTQ